MNGKEYEGFSIKVEIYIPKVGQSSLHCFNNLFVKNIPIEDFSEEAL